MYNSIMICTSKVTDTANQIKIKMKFIVRKRTKATTFLDILIKKPIDNREKQIQRIEPDLRRIYYYPMVY